MRKLVLLCISFGITFSVCAQEARTICVRIDELNTAVLNRNIKRAVAAKQFNTLIAQLNRARPSVNGGQWTFPLKGYNFSAVGGTNGNGYSDKGYNYLGGNKHSAHPAQDIFIRDKNQDCIDDKTNKPVDVLAVSAGYIIAYSNSWDAASSLRGGKYIWVYDDSGNIEYYAHNGSILVKPGDHITQGAKIAEVGRTGYNAYKKRSPTHLHFSAFKLSRNLPVPFNPYQQLKNAR